MHEKKYVLKSEFDPVKYSIILLAAIKDQSEPLTENLWLNSIVISPRSNGGWYILNDHFSHHCKMMFAPTEYASIPRGISYRGKYSITADLQGKKKDSVLPEGLIYNPKLFQSSAQEGTENAEMKEHKSDSKQTFKKCTCDVCVSAKTLYGKNMSDKGPQRLYRRDFDIQKLFQLLNMYDDDLKERLSLCFDYSFAAMDIESSTISLQGKEATPASTKTEYENTEWDHITPTPIIDEELKNTRVQRLCMIGHADFYDPHDPYYAIDLRTENDFLKNKSVFIFERKGKTEQEVVDVYAAHILHRKTILSEVKRELLQKELRIVGQYKEAHEHYFSMNGIDKDEKQCQDAWRFSLLGRLENQIKTLISQYYIFAFCGSSYDYLLIAPLLMTSPVLAEYKINVMRRGSNVSRISFKNQLVFADATRLLSAGVSLAKFAKSVGLKISKALFPYHLLDETESFLESSSLPSDPKCYWSDLTRTMPSQEEVNEALKTFEFEKFKTVRCYLKRYLEIDVILLLMATKRYFSKMWENSNLHVLAARRLTLAGFSDSLAQAHLVKEKRVGSFFVNHCYYYAHIRRALLGGISMSCKSATNIGEFKDTPCNNHLRHLSPESMEMDEDEKNQTREPGRAVIYLDVCNLYAYAVKLYI